MNTPICYITDNTYAMPTAVSIVSLLKNTPNAEIFVIGADLNEKSKTALESAGAKVLDFQNKYKNFNLNVGYLSPVIFFKFDLAEIFKDYDKILFLDSDVIINAPLDELLAENIEDFYLAAVKDMTGILKNGIENENYFNVGVMLLNLKKIREDNLQSKLLEDIKENLSEYLFPEQESFNKICDGKVKFLHPKFNYMASNSLFNKKTAENFYGVSKITPAIYHFVHLKPWHYKGLPYGSIWQKYYKISPFKNEKLSLKKAPFKIFQKRKFKNRWVIDFFGFRISYEKGPKNLKFFYP